jgi:two-component system nitrate/nitrite response regulator NarL
MDETITIAAVDDHPLFLQGLRRALRLAPDLKFVAEGHSAEEARRIAVEDRPDVLLLDIGIPGGGLEAARAIAASAPGVRIIIITGSDDDEHVAKALSSGVKGYLLKGAGASEVIEAVRAVRAGQPHITPAIASRLLMQKFRADGHRAKLNSREQQIMNYAAQGLSNKDIADKLSLKVGSVKNQMSRILQKLQARNRLAAIVAFKQN